MVQANNVWELQPRLPLNLSTTLGWFSEAANWPGWDLNLGLLDSSLSSCLASALTDPEERIMM